MSTCLNCCSSHGLCSTAPLYSATVGSVIYVFRREDSRCYLAFLYTMNLAVTSTDDDVPMLGPNEEITGRVVKQELSATADPSSPIPTMKSQIARRSIQSLSQEEYSMCRGGNLHKLDRAFFLVIHPRICPIARYITARCADSLTK